MMLLCGQGNDAQNREWKVRKVLSKARTAVRLALTDVPGLSGFMRRFGFAGCTPDGKRRVDAAQMARDEGRGAMTGVAVFEEAEFLAGGEGGYHTHRIPALVVTRAGTVLAVCEGRKNDRRDVGDIDLVLRRSSDGGRSWSEMEVIADDGEHTMGNPCPVADRESDTIWLPLCRNNQRILLMKSTDDGRTWSEPADITEEAMDTGWFRVGTGPGHGIQMRGGRLVIPCWADGVERLGEVQFSFVFYSDDGGRTWARGGALDDNTSDECEAVELADGSLYMNMRSRRGQGQRAYSFSRDGGESWSEVAFDARLPEPSCQGSIVRLTSAAASGKNRVLLACPASPTAREELTVRVSYDECRSWPVSKVVCSGSAAYSDLAVARDGGILCLYEAEEYRKLVLARFNLEWLTDGEDGG